MNTTFRPLDNTIQRRYYRVYCRSSTMSASEFTLIANRPLLNSTIHFLIDHFGTFQVDSRLQATVAPPHRVTLLMHKPRDTIRLYCRIQQCRQNKYHLYMD